jgi:hypothetical protein
VTCATHDQRRRSERFELELDEPFELEFEDRFELEFDDRLELEFDELFELEFELEFPATLVRSSWSVTAIGAGAAGSVVAG